MKKRVLAILSSLLFALGFGACAKKSETSDTSRFSSSAPRASSEEHLRCTFGEWITTLEPTCQQNGSKKRYCTVCGATETKNIPASTNHNTVNGKCTDCNKLTNAYEAFEHYVKQNGEYEDGLYFLLLGQTVYDGAIVGRCASYNTADSELELTLMWDSDYTLTITLNEDNSVYEYFFSQRGDYIYYMRGSLYPRTFSKNTTSLPFTSTNITNASLKTSFSKVGASLTNLLLVFLDNDIKDSGLTAHDLGFINY